MVKADLISRFGGKWEANYREGWLPLVALYTTGTATFTLDSRTVTGSGTVWTSAMKGRKILGPDGAYYKIASVTNGTTLIVTQPYQGTTTSGASYQIWKDEYRLYPEVLSLGGFVDYGFPSVTNEAWPRNMKASFPKPVSTGLASVHAVIGREPLTSSYSTGTVSGSAGSCILTGAGTSWLDNIEPGFEITVGAYTYHVKRVNSDTEIELYQKLVVAVAALSTYTSVGKNALIVRFQQPTSQSIVSYWYWAKDYPFVNDADEDWIAEMFPKVLINGLTYFDYVDKKDTMRADRASMAYELSIKDMKVAVDNAYSGVRTLGYDIPDSARD